MSARDATAPSPEELARFEATWADPRGWRGVAMALNHKTIGRRFILTALGFFAVGGLLAAAIRLQLARPDNDLVGPDLYNQIFTMHGTVMMFLFAVPVMQAVATYVVPLMIGARSIAFPRLNAYAYWIYLFGGVMLVLAFVLNVGPDVGWFAYVPLSGPAWSPGKRVDFWAQMITFTELSGLLEAVVIITTIFKLRALGMSLNRLPLYVWAVLVTAFMILFAMPAVMLASTALILDRLVGTHFYNPAAGGDPLLWQHLFWFFAHPEVYFIFIPGLGFISTILPAFTRRPVFGYTAIVVALVATGFLAFGLWVHHMFATPLPEVGKSFFTAVSMLIALPSALQIFCWLATLATGRLDLRTPLLFVLAFFFVLVLGGLTGLMLASVPLDLQLHDTYFVVAHLHYVLIGGAVFPLFGALYYWFPKLTGRLLGERLGRWQFWLFFVGFNLSFFPMHLLGLAGMPRRVYTYAENMGWGPLNQLATVGSDLVAISMLLFVVNVVMSVKRGALAGDNPWRAETLEWATTSPPPAGNFYRPPVVHGRDPLWRAPRSPAAITGLATEQREVLVTTTLDAAPDHRLVMPEPTPMPLLAALATTVFFVGSIFTPWAVVWGVPPIVVMLIAWFWPKESEAREHRALERRPA